MAAPYAGRKGVVYMSTSASGTASSCLQLNQWTINRTTDKIEVTSFGDTNKTYVQGLPDVQGTIGGFWNDGESKPFTGAASSDGVKFYLYPSSDAPTKYWYGLAWFDITMETQVSGAVTLTGNFAAANSWSNTF
jgi:hypothetical protein